MKSEAQQQQAGGTPGGAVADAAAAGMVARVRSHDWSRTPLGPMDRWPAALRVTVDLCLGSRFPMFVWWGPDLVNIYNDAYVPILGKRHPSALGRPAPEVWAEVWPVIGPQVEAVMSRGEASLHHRVPLSLERNGYPEEAYFTWSHSPVRDERGAIVGVLCVVTEETASVLAERERDRLAAQRQLALDAARLGWWHYDPATGVASFDRRYTEIFGIAGRARPIDEILKRLHPDDVPGVWAKVEAALDPADPKPYAAEYRIVLDDGSVRWVEAHGTATFAGAGAGRRAVSFVGTVADVTDRKVAADLPRTILESITDGFFALDRDWRFTYANGQAERLLDRAPGDLLGRVIWDVYPGVVRSAFDRLYRRAAADRAAGSATEYYPDHDRWYEVHAYPGADGGVSVYFRDVSERVRAEEARRRSEFRFERLVEQSPLSVQIFAPDGTIRQVNKAWERLWGFTPADIPGYSLLADPELERLGVAPLVRRAFAGEAVAIPPIPYRPDRGQFAGQARWVGAYIYPVRDASGRVEDVVLVHDDVTDRRAAEEALRESEARFRQLADAMPQIVWGARADGAVDYCNTKWREYFGNAAADPSGAGWVSVVHPDDLAAVSAAWSAAVAGGAPYVAEARLRRADGAFRWHLARALPVRDDAGAVVRWFGTNTDVHDQRLAAEALRDSEQRYRSLFTSIDEGFCVAQMLFDDAGRPVDYRFLEVNPAFERHTGLVGAVGRRVRELLPDLEPFWFETYGRVATTGEPVRFENPAAALGGRWYDVNAFRVGRPEDRRVAMLFTDVTHRKAAEAALRDSERRFREMADTAPAMLWITDPDGRCTFLSRGWYEFTGQTEAEGLGLGWADAAHPDDRDAVTRAFAAASEARGPYAVDFRLRRADATYRWVIDAGRPRFGPGGEFLGYIGSVIDIDDRKAAEAERERLLAAERAARELAETSRAQAEASRARAEALAAEADRANRLKDEFLATVSHELRTPLNAILGYAQLLRRGAASPDVADGLEVIRRNARSQAQIIDDLLDMSRVVSGKLRLDARAADLRAVVAAALDTVRPAADAKGIALLPELDPATPTVRGDPDRLQQVVWNLLANAVKFTPRGGTVRASVGPSADGSHAAVVVADTGQGISPAFLPHVFDKFRQADASASRRHGGLGIGLSLVKSLTELHGGRVRASSPGEGLGATFVLELPAAVAPPAPGSVAAGRTPGGQTA